MGIINIPSVVDIKNEASRVGDTVSNFGVAINQAVVGTGGALDTLGITDRQGEEAREKAADATVQANRENIDFQKWLYEQQKEMQMPWLNAGQEALARIQDTPDFTFTPDDISKFYDPAYQFRVNEGQNAIERGAAARGGQLSGAQQRRLMEYGQGMASQEYQNAFNRMQMANTNRYNQERGQYETNLGRQQSLAGVGQSTLGGIQNAGNVMGAQVGNSILNQGNAIAQRYYGDAQSGMMRSNNIMSGLFTLGGAYMGGS